MTDSRRLPPGQRAAPFERFGLPQFADRRVQVPTRPVLMVGGDVRLAAQFDLAELLADLPRHEQRSDLHCITTWSALDLDWSGVRLRDVARRVAESVEPHPGTRWLRATGLDGYQSCLLLDDAFADDVLLVDRLDGVPLTPDHGAPARLIAPAHYGYKSVKHLTGLDYLVKYDSGPAGWKGHPRARVAEEERSRLLPGPFWRRLWRLTLPVLRRAYRHE